MNTSNTKYTRETAGSAGECAEKGGPDWVTLSNGEVVEAYWNTADVMRCLGVSQMTVLRLLRGKNALPHYRIAKRILRYRPEEVRAWQARQARHGKKESR